MSELDTRTAVGRHEVSPPEILDETTRAEITNRHARLAPHPPPHPGPVPLPRGYAGFSATAR